MLEDFQLFQSYQSSTKDKNRVKTIQKIHKVTSNPNIYQIGKELAQEQDVTISLLSKAARTSPSTIYNWLVMFEALGLVTRRGKQVIFFNIPEKLEQVLIPTESNVERLLNKVLNKEPIDMNGLTKAKYSSSLLIEAFN